MSAATLSRIENEKQAIDVSQLLLLAKVLKCRPADLVDDGEPADDCEQLVKRIAALDSKTRANVWTDLAASTRRRDAVKARHNATAAQVEELLAQIDFLRAEIEGVKRRLR